MRRDGGDDDAFLSLQAAQKGNEEVDHCIHKGRSVVDKRILLAASGKTTMLMCLDYCGVVDGSAE